MKDKTRNLTGIFLLLLHAVTAVNAIGGGIYGINGAEQVPASWLQGSPFTSYFIPALFLLLVIGGSCIISFVLLLKKKKKAPVFSFLTGIILAAWILIQVRWIGFVSFLQPLVFVIALLIVLLSYRMRDKFH